MLIASVSTLLMAGTAHAETQAQDQSAPAAAAGQPDQANGADIIVTAQRRSERIQDVPISVTVVTGDQLARRGTQTIQELSQTSASLEFTSPTASPGGGGFVRGIGTQSFGSNTAQSSVSVVLDGIVLGNAPITDIFDVARVEVLKGPQGTLFGSSVSAGVLNITSNAPVIGQPNAFIDMELGPKALGSRYTRFAVRAGGTITISDNSALRIAVHSQGSDGLSSSSFNGKDSQFRARGIRARYLWNINDRLTLNIIGDYGTSNDRNQAGLVYRYVPDGTPLANALAACGLTASDNARDSCSDIPHGRKVDTGGVSGQIDWDLGGPTLTSLTSWRTSEETTSTDLINIAPSIARSVFGSQCNFVNCSPIVLLSTPPEIPQNFDRKLFTQEFRMASPSGGRLEYVLGLYYQRGTADILQPSRLIVRPPTSPVDVTLSRSNDYISTTQKDYAAFANATFHITSSTRLIAGARYTHSTVSEDQTLEQIASLNPAAPVGTFTGSLKVKDNAITWRAGIQHDFGHDTMAYATASTGYKAPQINDLSPLTMSGIKAERPLSFEIGVKQSLLNRRLFVNADLFYTRVSNFQTQSCIPDPSRGLLCTNINVDRINTKGAELELFGSPVKGMSMNVSAIYNVAKYPGGFLGADGTDLGGKQLNYASRFKITGSIEQEFPISDDYRFVVSADATYRTKQSMYLSAESIYTVPAAVLVNGRIGIRTSSKVDLYLFARNLFDEVYPTQLYPTSAFSPGGIWQAVDQQSGRVVGLQLQARF